MIKILPVSAGDTGDVGSIPGWGRSPRVKNGNSLQYSCLEIPWTGEPGGLQSTGSQTVGHNLQLNNNNNNTVNVRLNWG